MKPRHRWIALLFAMTTLSLLCATLDPRRAHGQDAPATTEELADQSADKSTDKSVDDKAAAPAGAPVDGVGAEPASEQTPTTNSAAIHQEPTVASGPALAFIDLETESVDDHQAQALSQELWAHLLTYKDIPLLPRQETRRWLLRHDLFPFLPYGPQIPLDRVARALSVEYLVTGHVNRLDNDYTFDVNVFSVARGHDILAQSEPRRVTASQTLAAMSDLARQIHEAIGRNEAQLKKGEPFAPASASVSTEPAHKTAEPGMKTKKGKTPATIAGRKGETRVAAAGEPTEKEAPVKTASPGTKMKAEGGEGAVPGEVRPADLAPAPPAPVAKSPVAQENPAEGNPAEPQAGAPATLPEPETVPAAPEPVKAPTLPEPKAPKSATMPQTEPAPLAPEPPEATPAVTPAPTPGKAPAKQAETAEPTPEPATPAAAPAVTPVAAPAGDAVKARQLFKEAQALDPTSPDYLARLRQAAELDPANLPAQEALARTYYVRGQYTESLAQTERTLKDHPQAAMLQTLRAISLFELGRYDEARKANEAILAANPDNNWARYNLALALTMLKAPNAAATWREYIKRAQGDPTQQNLVEEARRKLAELEPAGASTTPKAGSHPAGGGSAKKSGAAGKAGARTAK